MRILAIETSGHAGGVAIFDGDKRLAMLDLPTGQRSAQSLAPTIVQALKMADWPPAHVQLVAVVTGPGSFTGLRLGVTTAKTLAYAIQAEVLGVNTLEVVARQTPVQPGATLHVVLDAQRKELFVARYRADGAAWSVADPVRIESADDWLAALEPGCVATGPGFEKLAGRLPNHVSAAPAEQWSPRAETVGLLAAEHYRAGRRDDVWRLAPAYFRRSAAEEKADADSKR